MPGAKDKRRGLKPLEIVVIAGILLAFIVPALERGGKPDRQRGAETQLFQEDQQAAQDEAARIEARQQIANYLKVGAFIFMAILVPTLLIRERLREKKSRRR